jgi:mannose-6-phosphate isomerase
MASSDNVLRGGLTAKHIDVKELLKHVKCEANEVRVLNGDKEGNITVYRTTAPDFELSSFDLRKSESVLLEPDTTEILLLTRGNTLLKSGKNSMELMIGAPSAVIFPGHLVEMQAKEHSLVFKASVPGAGR